MGLLVALHYLRAPGEWCHEHKSCSCSISQCITFSVSQACVMQCLGYMAQKSHCDVPIPDSNSNDSTGRVVFRVRFVLRCRCPRLASESRSCFCFFSEYRGSCAHGSVSELRRERGACVTRLHPQAVPGHIPLVCLLALEFVRVKVCREQGSTHTAATKVHGGTPSGCPT